MRRFYHAKVLAHTLVLALLFSCPSWGGGTPVREVRTEWSDAAWGQSDLHAITDAYVGRDASPEQSRELVRALSASGRVARVSVREEPVAGGTRWVLALEPRRIVEAVDVSPTSRVSLEGILPAPDSDISPSDIRGIELAVRAAFRGQAFGGSRAVVTVSPGSAEGRVRVHVALTQGTQRELAKVSFTLIGAEASELRPFLSSYAVNKGDVPLGTAVDESDRALESAMSEAGYASAVVSHVVAGSENESQLRVTVNAGPRTIWSFEGLAQYDESALRGVISEATERSPGNLRDRIHAFYTNRGYMDVDVSVETRVISTWRISTRFHVREGARIAVEQTELSCLDESALAGLSNAPTDSAGILSEIGSFLREDLPHTGLFSAGVEQNARALFTGPSTESARGVPAAVAPRPETTYDESTYDKALEHLRDLYRAEGFLSARVGPVERVRARCLTVDARGQCKVDMAAASSARACTRDVRGLPTTARELVESNLCIPDVGRGVHCAPTMSLRIPLDLGPRTYVGDILMEGAHAAAPQDLVRISEIRPGDPLSAAEAEAARVRLRDYYRELGYAFTRVDWRSEFSIDATRARLRFDVWEGERVMVTEVVIRGANYTDVGLVKKRVALSVGHPYQASLVQQTQEQISTLGVFNAVDVSLENPDSPESKKRVIISVRERVRFSFDPIGGFSTGEGFRAGAEASYRNLFGKAISLTANASAAYLPTPFIGDDTVRANFVTLGEPGLDLDRRIAARLSGGLQFPDIGLGPTVRGNVDALFVNDLQRDYRISKLTLVPTLSWRPSRRLQLTLGPSIERNVSGIFQGLTREQLVKAKNDLGSTVASTALIVPDGESVAYGQKLSFTFDARDQSLNPTKGFFLALGVEHIDASPIFDPKSPPNCFASGTCDSHFFKLTGTASTYLRLRGRLRLAFQLRAGTNMQLTDKSNTYPDRLFFLGGSDSMRAWGPSSLIPQDVADAIAARSCTGDAKESCDLLLAAIRGGNLMINPRAELRIPMGEPFEGVVFVDAGNLWKDPDQYPWNSGKLKMRYALGTGLRYITPVFPVSIDVGVNPSPYSWETYQTGSWAVNFAIGLY